MSALPFSYQTSEAHVEAINICTLKANLSSHLSFLICIRKHSILSPSGGARTLVYKVLKAKKVNSSAWTQRSAAQTFLTSRHFYHSLFGELLAARRTHQSWSVKDPFSMEILLLNMHAERGRKTVYFVFNDDDNSGSLFCLPPVVVYCAFVIWVP